MNISYSAAQDPFHSIFRVCSILEYSKRPYYEFDRILINDFFVCFPWMITEIEGSRKIPGFIRAQNQVVRRYPRNSYEQIPASRIMFKRMRPAQLASLNSLCSFGYIRPEDFRRDVVQRTIKPLPERLHIEATNYIYQNRELFDFVSQFLDALPLSTALGLKAKTGLEEFRYDYVQA